MAKTSRLTNEDIDRFEKFWSAYPKKRGKLAAQKAWSKIGPNDDLLDKMLATLDWQCKDFDWTKDGGQFIPLPATWLNQGRWDDEPMAAPQALTVSERTRKNLAARESLLARMRLVK